MSHGHGKPRAKQHWGQTQGHHNNAADHNNNTEHPPVRTPQKVENKTPANSSQKSETKEPNKTRSLGMSRFEGIMTLLTILGLIVTGFTGAIFMGQLHAMVTDQRPWLTMIGRIGRNLSISQVSSGDYTITSEPILITNIGKTPARMIAARAVMEVVTNGRSPRLIYEGMAHAYVFTGILFPNASVDMTAHLLELDANDRTRAHPRNLSLEERRQLLEGTDYVVVYARATYEDTFGAEHWGTFCEYGTLARGTVELTAKSCTDYNDADHNQPSFLGELKRLFIAPN